jgi:hypothetical protein
VVLLLEYKLHGNTVKQSNNHFFVAKIRNNETQEIKSVTIKKKNMDAAAEAALAAVQLLYGWSNTTLLEVSERLIGSSQPQIDS